MTSDLEDLRAFALLHGFPPDHAMPPISSANRIRPGHQWQNLLAELQRAGLPDPNARPVKKEAAPAALEPLSAPAAGDGTSVSDFAATVADLIEEEIRRRTGAVSDQLAHETRRAAALVKQNDSLRNEIADLRQELATAQAMEERIRADGRREMEAALERVISGARL